MRRNLSQSVKRRGEKKETKLSSHEKIRLSIRTLRVFLIIRVLLLLLLMGLNCYILIQILEY